MPEIALVKTDKPLEAEIFKFLLDFIEPKKQIRILRTRVKQNADAMLAGEILAKVLIKRAFGVDISKQIFAAGKYGKPFLPEYPNIHFNISHSGEWAVCAVSNAPVGIDIQKITPYNPAVAKRVCSNEEIHKIETGSNPASEFIKLWTKKEALLKMLGTGIGSGLGSIGIDSENENNGIKSCLEIKKYPDCLGEIILQSQRIEQHYWLSVATRRCDWDLF